MNPYLSLILPCFNEAEHLKKSMGKLIRVLKTFPYSYEIIFVEDNSTDKTLLLIKAVISQNPEIDCKLIIHQKNQGRGKSVVDGIRVSGGTIVGFIDIDLEVDPEYIGPAISRLSKADVVVGKRSYDFSLKQLPRYAATKMYAFLVKFLLKLPVSDSEAGFKFFRREKILPVLDMTHHWGWFWDTEIVAYAALAGLKLVEFPVVYKRRMDKTSTVNLLKDSIYYFFNVLRLSAKLHRKKDGV